MPLTDLAYSELVAYRSSVPVPADFDEFWARTLTQSRQLRQAARVENVRTGLRIIETSDVTFSGFDGQPIKAWYHRPKGAGELPVVIRYQGYGGGRGLSHQVGPMVAAGYALLEVDTRGQGSGWSPGDTADSAGSLPAAPGFVTKGILDPDEYYYRRVFTDAVLAVDCARELPGVDGRVAVMGASQGGGISIAVASLAEDVAAVMADVPFLSDFRRGAEIASRNPYLELAGYLAVHSHHLDQVFETLSYFDVAVLGRLADAPALFSVALMDEVCPPSTVYAAYNSYGGDKEMRVYPFNGHEGGQGFQEAEQLRWLEKYLPL